jgi:hypothetical protein
MTLFVPRRGNGFVSPTSGKVNLRNILVPCDLEPHPQRAIDAVSALVEILAVNDVTLTFLHVGDRDRFPALQVPKGEQV